MVQKSLQPLWRWGNLHFLLLVDQPVTLNYASNNMGFFYLGPSWCSWRSCLWIGLAVCLLLLVPFTLDIYIMLWNLFRKMTQKNVLFSFRFASYILIFLCKNLLKIWVFIHQICNCCVFSLYVELVIVVHLDYKKNEFWKYAT
jgi:hypothetical protein